MTTVHGQRTMDKYNHIIELIARGCNLDPLLVKAIISVESSWKEDAVRYEPAFYDRYVNPLKGSQYPVEDHKLLASSIGLMQIMGLVAREHGFQGRLEDLFIPEVNILYGCIHLRGFLDRYHNVEDAVASYNSGSPRRGLDGKYVNQSYVNKVMKAYQCPTFVCRCPR